MNIITRIRTLVDGNKGLGYLTVGTVLANIVGGIFWLIVAGLTTVEVYGEATYFTSVASFVISVILIGIPIFLTTFVAKGLTGVRQEVATLAIVLAAAGAVVSYMVFQYLPLSVLIFGVGVFSVSIQDLLGSGFYRRFALTNIGQRTTSLILALFLYFSFGFDGLILGIGISFIIFGHRALGMITKEGLSLTLLKEKKKFLLHSWGLDVSRAIANSSDKFLIAPIFGYVVLGHYQLGIQFLMLLAMIPNIMFPYLLREEARGVNRRYVKIYGLAVTMGLSVIIFALAPYVIPFLFPKFIESIPLIQISIFGAPLMALNSILATEFLGREKSSPVFIGSGMFLALSYTFMYILGTAYGSIGLVYGLLIAISSQTTYLYSAKHKLKSVNSLPGSQ